MRALLWARRGAEEGGPCCEGLLTPHYHERPLCTGWERALGDSPSLLRTSFIVKHLEVTGDSSSKLGKALFDAKWVTRVIFTSSSELLGVLRWFRTPRH